MGGDEASDISAGAGEGVDGVVIEAGLASGSIARSGASEGGSTVGAETLVDNDLVKVRGFSEGEDIETLPENPFEAVKARIVGGDERQVDGRGSGDGDHRIDVCL